MVLHLPTTQCSSAEFEDFAKQRNSGGGCEIDLPVYGDINLLVNFKVTVHLIF
jgi:hypothetical protein